MAANGKQHMCIIGSPENPDSSLNLPAFGAADNMEGICKMIL